MRPMSGLALKIQLCCVLSLAVCVPGARAQTAALVEDIATQEAPGPFWSMTSFAPFGQSLLFEVAGQISGTEPWVTDGTVAGTRMLADTCEGPCGAGREALWPLGKRLVWLANGRLWSSDGTPAGTIPLTEADLTVGDQYTNDGVLLGGRLYFRGCHDTIPCALWSTDGTPEGTRPVPIRSPGAAPERLFSLTAGADRIYYFAGSSFLPPWDTELWMADANGARKVQEIPGGYIRVLAAWRNRIFFLRFNDSYRKLWVSDGTPEGTRPVASFESVAGWVTTGSKGFYFVADDGRHGREIWISDGTAQGTRRITNTDSNTFVPFDDDVYEDYHEIWAVETRGQLLFAAFKRGVGTRLWSTTGTPESTRVVSELEILMPFVLAGDRFLVQSHDVEQGDCEIWSIDGGGKGTRLVEGFPKRSCDLQFPVDPIRLRVFGSHVYFPAPDSPSQWSLWRTDGTKQGTVRLFSAPYVGGIAVTADEESVYYGNDGIWLWNRTDGARPIVREGARNRSSLPRDLVAHQGTLFFTADAAGDGTGRTIWSSQGSVPDTVPVLSGGATDCEVLDGLVSAGSSLFFRCDPTPNDGVIEIRKVNPAGGGSVLVTDDAMEELPLLAHGDRIWYREYSPSGIWTSDGTAAGTAPLRDADGNPLHTYLSTFEPFAASDGHLVYLLAARPGESFKIWRSDGTPAGTFPLIDSLSNQRLQVARAGSTTLILVDGDLWRTDGTVAGTARLTAETGGELPIYRPDNLAAHHGAFYLYGSASADYGTATFWRTDGTAAGTVALAEPFPLFRLFGLSLPHPVGLGDRVFFAMHDPEHGLELWATDGTPAGTSLVKDIARGTAYSVPDGLMAAGDAVWFTVQESVHGRELWRTDGTPAGTRLVQDIAPEGLSSSPDQLTVLGDRLFFSADDGVNGREPWVLPLAGSGRCQPSETVLCLRDGRFAVEVRWRDFQDHGGTGRAVPLTGDTGTFWFFDPGNVEVLLKVLDGRGLNDHFWVFYGALSNVEYSVTVTDTQTGLARRYWSPAGQLASVGDTRAFGPHGARSAAPDLFLAPPSPPALVRGWTSAAAATGACASGPQRLCLNGGRFAVEVSWKDFAGRPGEGTAVPFSGDTGFFWFFDAANLELAVKVLDGTPLNGRFWVFYGALSNVEYSLKVTDTQTGAVKEYRNPSGRFGSVGDTGAF